MLTSQHGFTLIELMVATAITGILASIAYPSFQGPILKARRTDGITALLQLQLSQERWRADHGSYASLSELKLNASSSMGYYQLSAADTSASGYTVLASATGLQARDGDCKVLRLTVADGNTDYRSGADASTSNASAVNKRCWGL